MRNALITAWGDNAPVFEESSMIYMNYQREVCPTSLRFHWQCYVECKTSAKLGYFKKRFGNDCHVVPVTIDNGASRYCLKDETAVEGTRREFGVKKAEGNGRGASNNILYEQIRACENWDEVLPLKGVGHQLAWARDVFARKPVKKSAVENLRPWQQEEVDLLKVQDDRTVRFIVDDVGNTGKTALGKWLVENMDAFYCTGGKIADIMHAYERQEYVVFDMARCKDHETWPYEVMEFMKNGMGFSGKYESKMKKFNPCKIIVFANCMPDTSKLSRDRISLRNLR